MDEILRPQISLDSCAFDPKYWPENEAAKKILELEEREVLDILKPYSVEEEINHPNTPSKVKEDAGRMIYTVKANELNVFQIQRLKEIESILEGNSKTGKMRKDAQHIFECARASVQHFITVDKGILKKNNEIKKLCGIEVLTPSEFLRLLSSINSGLCGIS